MQEPSIFTKIVRGEIPSHKIYEDDQTMAFLDITPNVVGHTLVIPKKQVDQFNDLDDETYHALWATVKKVADNHQAKLDTDRIGISVKGVDVPHAHVHVLPFNVGEHMGPHDDSPKLSNEELAELAKKLAF
jgi:histidine triad (HIT) family protein